MVGAPQALNDLFEKILQRDVPARYLLRLGMGEAELATTLDFSRVGRVNAMLARRLELLAEVKFVDYFGFALILAFAKSPGCSERPSTFLFLFIGDEEAHDAQLPCLDEGHQSELAVLHPTHRHQLPYPNTP